MASQYSLQAVTWISFRHWEATIMWLVCMAKPCMPEMRSVMSPCPPPSLLYLGMASKAA